MTHYTIAVGPKMPDRMDRIVAIIGQTPHDSFFRRAASAEDVHRIAAECGVSAETIQWAIGAYDAATATGW